jgi:hypothetical protein
MVPSQCCCTNQLLDAHEPLTHQRAPSRLAIPSYCAGCLGVVGGVLTAEQLARAQRRWAQAEAWRAVVEGMTREELMRSAAEEAQQWEERLERRFALQEEASYAADAASCADFAAAIVDGYADLADALDEREAGIQADREGMRAQAAWHDPVWGRWCEDGVVVGEEWDGDVDDTMTMGPDDVWEDEDEDEDSYESEGGDADCCY